ncbi:MAG: hypothetical protein Sylvanvirus3_15 [Sylvanvirus sp.]|uniref:Uncharacterized protein n=1 Tax=Sylvanvirus sp. TaxID=2487774 RepID=A0A3G5AJG7_9VIRU|nr:MAG: hypothetical protein Sylvanvirus3_15 [Sylvanvirus sp.]
MTNVPLRKGPREDDVIDHFVIDQNGTVRNTQVVGPYLPQIWPVSHSAEGILITRIPIDVSFELNGSSNALFASFSWLQSYVTLDATQLVPFPWGRTMKGYKTMGIAELMLWSWGIAPPPFPPRSRLGLPNRYHPIYIDGNINNPRLNNLAWQRPPYGLGKIRTKRWWNEQQRGNPRKWNNKHFTMGGQSYWGVTTILRNLFPDRLVRRHMTAVWTPILNSLQNHQYVDIPASNQILVRITRDFIRVASLLGEQWQVFDRQLKAPLLYYVSQRGRFKLQKPQADLDEVLLEVTDTNLIVYNSDSNVALPMQAPVSFVVPIPTKIQWIWNAPGYARLQQLIRERQLDPSHLLPVKSTLRKCRADAVVLGSFALDQVQAFKGHQQNIASTYGVFSRYMLSHVNGHFTDNNIENLEYVQHPLFTEFQRLTTTTGHPELPLTLDELQLHEQWRTMKLDLTVLSNRLKSLLPHVEHLNI